MMEHLLIYQEFHGDLHPGNIMADVDAHLFLIDWGNSVEMRGKWGLIGRYFLAVVSGDVENLARILIDLSTEQKVDESRYREIKALLRDTLEKKDITPLRRDFVLQLLNEGSEGLQQRLQTAVHLMSNTYHLGLTIKSDYLHLSRSLFAMAGTYNNLYRGLSGWTMARDFALDVALFPVKYTFNQILAPASKVEKRALRPGALSRRKAVRKAPLYNNAEGADFLDGVYYPACARRSSLPPAAGTWRV